MARPELLPAELVPQWDKEAIRAYSPESEEAQALPEGAQRVLYGLSLWLAGWSKTAAAKKVSLQPATLDRYITSLELADRDRTGAVDAVDENALELLGMAADKIRESLDKLPLGKVVDLLNAMMAQILRSEDYKLRAAGQRDQSHLQDRLATLAAEMMKGGGSLRIEVKRPEAIPEKVVEG